MYPCVGYSFEILGRLVQLLYCGLAYLCSVSRDAYRSHYCEWRGNVRIDGRVYLSWLSYFGV